MRCHGFLFIIGLIFLMVSLAGCFESDDHPPEILEIDVTSENVDGINVTYSLTVSATVVDADQDITSVEWRYKEPSILQITVRMRQVATGVWVGKDTRAIVSGDLRNLSLADEVTIEVKAYDSKGNVASDQQTVSLRKSVPTPESTDASHGLSDVVVSRRNITLTLWDYAQEDGDIVDIYLNQKPIALKVEITHDEQTFSLILNTGRNELTIHAVNEGEIPPNTSAIRISHVVKGEPEQSWELGLGEDGSFTITVQ